MKNDPTQLGFDELLADAAADNRVRAFEHETAHLPGNWPGALAYHRRQIADHHAAMLATDFVAAMSIREEAHLLATKLNGGDPGILAGKEAPGCRLNRAGAAEAGAVPLWGQAGEFETETAGMRLAVEMDGMFGIGATSMPYLGFAVRASDPDMPFLSETGYRSFLGCSVPPKPGMTTEAFVRRVVEIYVARELKGRLLRIKPFRTA